MNLSDVTAELAQALSACGLSVSATGVGEVPAVIINPPLAIRYNTAGNNACEVDFRVSVLVSAADEASAITLLNRLFSYEASGTATLVDALIATYRESDRYVRIDRAGSFGFDPDHGAYQADLYLTITS